MYQQPNQTNNNIMIILVQTGSFEVRRNSLPAKTKIEELFCMPRNYLDTQNILNWYRNEHRK